MQNWFFSVLTVGIIALTVGCGRSPASPTSIQLPTLVEISLCCARPIVVPGDSLQLQVSVRFSDGSVMDVTSRATWRSSDAVVATVTATGLVSFWQEGDVRITARYQNEEVAWLARVTSPASGS